MQNKILVIVVTYNGMQWIERCISSVVGSTVPADLVVVDNGSTDGTLEYLQGRPGVRLIQSGENLGFGAANNIGLQIALDEGYDFVYLLNQDAWVEKDTLEVLTRAMKDAGPHWGILSPLQKDADGTLDRNFSNKCGKYLEKCGSVPVEVPFVMAAHWLMRADCVRRVGGFSPAFKQYGEDDNYIDRLHFCGLKCGIIPSASAVHDRAKRDLPRQKRIYLKCTGALVRLMNPSRPFWLGMMLLPIELCATSAKNLSAGPLRYLTATWRQITSLAGLRAESLGTSAFLTNH